MSINDIKEKYKVDLDNINRYLESVKNLVINLCNTKYDLISELPMLYKSVLEDSIAENYSDIVKEIYDLEEKIQMNINAIAVKKAEDNCVTPDDPTADGDLMLFFYSQIEKGNTNREELFKQSQSVLETLCIMKGPLIHGERFYELYDHSEEVYRLIDIALNDNLKKRKWNFVRITK